MSQVPAPQTFEQKYRDDPDPWGFESNPYELARYERILEHVPPGRYASAFEPGCSIGVLTEGLARRCDEVLATDVSPTALAQAQVRCRDLAKVTLRCGSLGSLSPGSFDLIVFSEIGYYFARPVLAEHVESLGRALRPGGRLVAAHWLGQSPDHALRGTDVHAVLAAHLALRRHHHHIEVDLHRDGFVLDVWDDDHESE